MTYVLSEGKGYFTASIDDIMHETGEWDLKRWHEELERCADSEVLEAYVRLRAYNPCIYSSAGKNAEAKAIKESAVTAMRSHLMEQMSPQNWGNKWWMQ